MRIQPHLKLMPMAVLILASFESIAIQTVVIAQQNTPAATPAGTAAQQTIAAATPTAAHTGASGKSGHVQSAQKSVPQGFHLFGSLRMRVEDWNWFPTDKANGAYTFLGSTLRTGISRQTSRDDVLLELSAPLLAGLPTKAIAPAPQGQLGQGATYRAENGGQVAGLFIKQAFVRFKDVGSPANSLRLGRFEFSDGAETTPADTTLVYLKQNRIAERLIGPFGFTHIGRSFDGIHFANDRTGANLTAMFAFPTRGVFDLNGMDTLTNIKIGYLSATFPQSDKTGVGEGRVFAIYYEDTRGHDVIKTDNRPLTGPGGSPNLSSGVPGRKADTGAISLGTVGGNYVRTFTLDAGKVDTLFWGAGQFGSWGALNQGAFSFDVEAGFQPKATRMKPWVRGGYFYASGDGNPNNNQHGTFFPLLFTPRIYARDPFFTESNLTDLFIQLILRPDPKLSIRSDIHGLRLADSNDLWYIGGGAYKNSVFGYSGRPSNGHSNLATLFDISFDYQMQKSTGLTLYLAYVNGGAVITSIYKSRDSAYAYLELRHKF